MPHSPRLHDGTLYVLNSGTGEFGRIEGYVTGTVRASVPVGEHLELFGRIENLTDEDYQEIFSFAAAGRAAYGGVRARF